MGAKMDRVIAGLQRKLTVNPSTRSPTRWDPFFKDYMTLEEVYCYPGEHFDFHKTPVALASATD